MRRDSRELIPKCNCRCVPWFDSQVASGGACSASSPHRADDAGAQPRRPIHCPRRAKLGHGALDKLSLSNLIATHELSVPRLESLLRKHKGGETVSIHTGRSPSGPELRWALLHCTKTVCRTLCPDSPAKTRLNSMDVT